MILSNTRLTAPVYPNPSADGSRGNQFAPLPDGKAGFRVGVNELIFRVQVHDFMLFKFHIVKINYLLFAPGGRGINGLPVAAFFAVAAVCCSIDVITSSPSFNPLMISVLISSSIPTSTGTGRISESFFTQTILPPFAFC